MERGFDMLNGKCDLSAHRLRTPQLVSHIAENEPPLIPCRVVPHVDSEQRIDEVQLPLPEAELWVLCPPPGLSEGSPFAARCANRGLFRHRASHILSFRVGMLVGDVWMRVCAHRQEEGEESYPLKAGVT